MKHFLFFISILTLSISISQNSRVDSLEQAIALETNDTNKFLLYNDLSTEVWHTDIEYFKEIWFTVLDELDKPYEDPKFTSFMKNNLPVAYVNLGFYYERIGQPDSAIYYYKKCAERSLKNNDAKLLANSYNNLASVYSDQGNFELGLELYNKAYKIQDELEIYEGAAVSLNNIGWVYGEQEMYAASIPYYRKSLRIKKRIDDLRGMGFSYNNLGKAHGFLGNSDSSQFYINKAIASWSEINFYYGLCLAHMSLGDQFYNQNPDKSWWYYNNALAYADSSGSIEHHATILIKLGYLDMDNLQYNKALQKALEAEQVALKIGYPSMIRDVSDLLQQVYSKKENWQKAYEQQNRYYKMRDSLLNDQTKRDVISIEVKNEYEKKELADSLRREEKAKITEVKHQEQVARQNVFIYIGFGGFVLAIGIVILVYRSYKNKKRDNEIIASQKEKVELQKQMIEEAHEEITDSIEYAKNIQDAILPPPGLWDKHLKDSFVLYLPKDIVAGDFYWMEKTENAVIFAAADCTGHGVPGAMVSVVCHNALTRAVREMKMRDPGKILDKVTDLVIETFEQSDRKVKDGMDISLCAFHPDSKELSFAGAHNPLWIVRKGPFEDLEVNFEHAGQGLYEVKANKQPVGQYDNRVPFITHQFKLQEGDQFYLFSDGFPDQFGGENGKKLKSKNFKKLILEHASYSIAEQKQNLNLAFDQWKGKYEQLDDVCVIGVRI